MSEAKIACAACRTRLRASDIRRRAISSDVPDAGRGSGSVSGPHARPSRAHPGLRPCSGPSAWPSGGRSPSWSPSGSAAWLGTRGRVPRSGLTARSSGGGGEPLPPREKPVCPRPSSSGNVGDRPPRSIGRVRGPPRSPPRTGVRIDRHAGTIVPDRPGSGVVPPRVDAGRLQEPRRRRARSRLQRLVLRRLPQPGRRGRRRSQRQERRHPLARRCRRVAKSTRATGRRPGRCRGRPCRRGSTPASAPRRASSCTASGPHRSTTPGGSTGWGSPVVRRRPARGEATPGRSPRGHGEPGHRAVAAAGGTARLSRHPRNGHRV